MDCQVARGPGMRLAIHKMVPRHVVAGVEAVKVAVHALQFLGAVVGQWFVGLVLFPLRLLLRQARALSLWS